MISPATIPFRAEFIEEESCCWYACANSITFFARMITPTAPIMASTSVFKLLIGFKTSDTPEAWTGMVSMDAAVTMPAAIGTICFFNLPFLLNVVTVMFSLFIMVESFLFTINIWLLAAMLLVSMILFAPWAGWFYILTDFRLAVAFVVNIYGLIFFLSEIW